MDIDAERMKGNLIRHLPVICALFIVLIWSLYIFNKSAPVAEGTYLVYADLIISGEVPYLDFEFMYTPLYTYLLTGLVYVFGTKVIVMRAMGAFFYMCIVLGFYLIFRNITNRYYASICAVVGFFVTMYDAFDLIGDYHCCYVSFALFQFYYGILSIKMIKEGFFKEKSRTVLYLSLAGLFGALCFLTKPQAGLVYFLFITASIIAVCLIYSISLIESLYSLVTHLFWFVLPITVCFALVAIFSSFSDFIQMVFLGGSKGGIPNMLTYHLFEILEKPVSWQVAAITIVLYYFLYPLISESRDQEDERVSVWMARVFALLTFVLMALILFVPFFSDIRALFIQIITINEIFVIALVLELLMLGTVISNRLKGVSDFNLVKDVFVLGAFVSIAYTGLFGGAMSYIPAGPLYAFLILVVFRCLEVIRDIKIKNLVKYVSLYIPVFLSLWCVAGGVLCPYSWWCSSEGPAYYCTERADIEYFDGIAMTTEEKDTYETFIETCSMYLGPDDVMYCYSNTICFYTLAHKAPVVQAVIPWFDICRQSTLLSDLDYLQSNNPKMIVFTDHGQFAIDAHAEQYGSKEGNQAVYDWLLFCANDPSSPYTVVQTYDLGMPGYVMIRI